MMVIGLDKGGRANKGKSKQIWGHSKSLHFDAHI